MQNLLHREWTAQELTEIFQRRPRVPLLPPYHSEPWLRAAQNRMLRDLTQPLRQRALEEATEPMPVLTDELYASFRRTGSRLEFERPYSERRRRLGRAVISLLLAAPDDPARGTLLVSMLEKYTSIFEDVSWALAAHVNWHNDDVSGKEPFQIDLLCAETANLMAEVLDLFGDLIPAPLQARVRQRLQSHIFENYANRFDEFHWTKATHNWNAVCHQGVLGAALSQVEDPALLARMLLLARGSLRLFLSGFTPDGGCTEGIGYWSYGFGWFTVLNEQLETRTGGELSLFEGDEQVRRIARFGPRMALAGGKLVNFSDNNAEGRLGPALMAYLGRRLDEPGFRRESAQGYAALHETGIAMEIERCNVFYLGRLCLLWPETLPACDEALPEDCFLPDLAVLVAHGLDRRGHRWDVAAKAGHNDEHHNHNDCGNFLLNIDGHRLVMEIGAPEYNKDFFSPKRYEALAARSLGHSLPVINGCEQAPGAAYSSHVLRHALDADRAEFVVDATAAYPPEAGCRRFVRTLRLDKPGGRLTLSDEFELERAENLEGALIFLDPVELDGHATIRSGGLELRVVPGAATKLDRVEVLHYAGRTGEECTVHRLVLRPAELSSRVTLEVDFLLT